MLMSNNYTHREWDRLPEETAKAYERFKYFLSLGQDRSLYQVADFFFFLYVSIGAMSSKYNWTARAMAWDRYRVSDEYVQEAQREEYILDSKSELKVEEAADYSRLLQLFRSAVVRLEDDKTLDASEYIKALSNLMKFRDNLSTFQRRNLNLPTRGGSAKMEDDFEDDNDDVDYEVTADGTLTVITKNNLSA